MKKITPNELKLAGLYITINKYKILSVYRKDKQLYPYKNSRGRWYIRFTDNYKTTALSYWKVIYCLLSNKEIEQNEDVICKTADTFNGLNCYKWHYENLVKMTHKEATIYGLERSLKNEKK